MLDAQTCYTQDLKSLPKIPSPNYSSPEIAVVWVKIGRQFCALILSPIDDFRVFKYDYKPYIVF